MVEPSTIQKWFHRNGFGKPLDSLTIDTPRKDLPLAAPETGSRDMTALYKEITTVDMLDLPPLSAYLTFDITSDIRDLFNDNTDDIFNELLKPYIIAKNSDNENQSYTETEKISTLPPPLPSFVEAQRVLNTFLSYSGAKQQAFIPAFLSLQTRLVNKFAFTRISNSIKATLNDMLQIKIKLLDNFL